jgi:hypothetical protein
MGERSESPVGWLTSSTGDGWAIYFSSREKLLLDR